MRVYVCKRERPDFLDPVSFWSVFGCGFLNLVAFKAVNLFSECMFSNILKLIFPSPNLNCPVNTKL